MQLLANEAPEIRQHLITTSIGAQALGGQNFLSSLIIFEKRGYGLKAFRKVKKEIESQINKQNDTRTKNNCLILQPHKSFRSSLLARYLAYPTITFNESSLSSLAEITVPRVAVLHEAHRIGLLLEPLGLSRNKIVESRPILHSNGASVIIEISKEFESHENENFIGIAPGSVWETKRWPLEHFAALVNVIFTNIPNSKIVLLGSYAEKAIAQSILEQVKPNSNIVSLAGSTNLQDLLWIVPRLKMMICNDSSLLHYASAFNIPSLGIFGATIPAMGFGPLANHSQTAELQNLECRPCSDHGPKVCPLQHFKCMRELSINSVATLAKDVFYAAYE
ncbi:MAG: glycosyltransferase family 9 protein [Oligoflexales bacterium]|nr:glycosyltransferase family 9 protein [Oligoflexales bacterium]